MKDAARIEALVRRWIEEGWKKGNAGVVDELHTADFVDHDAAGRSRDNEGFKQGIIRLYEAFPDFTARVEDVLVSGDGRSAAVRWSGRGTQRGAYLGAAPEGRVISFKGIEILRFRDGRIAERWGEWDGIDLLAQLGRIQLPPDA